MNKDFRDELIELREQYLDALRSIPHTVRGAGQEPCLWCKVKAGETHLILCPYHCAVNPYPEDLQ